MRNDSVASSFKIVTTFAALLLGGSVGHAQSDPSNATVRLARDHEARARFTAGRAAYDDGRFEDALHDFRRAYELSDRPSMLYNIASAAEKLRLDEEALAAYEAYLEQVPDADNRAFTESRIALLREQLASGEDRTTAAPPPPVVPVEAPGAAAPDEPRERPVVRKWWLWTVVGVVAGGGIAAAVLLTRPEDSFTGSDGMTHEALTIASW